MNASIEVHRGALLESVHQASVVVCDGDGKTVQSWGDPDLVTFPRSAIKAVQALPLIESGAAEAYGFGDTELALACASHSGEPEHARTATAMLAAAELNETCLECGGHWSFDQSTLIGQARAHDITPGAVFNNCSGKHAGFCCTAAHTDVPTEGYVNPDHPVQDTVRRTLEDLTGIQHDARNRAVDGCSIPTYAIPLRSMAHAFARMTTGTGLDAARAKAATRLLNACMAEPFHMAGTNRVDTLVMRAAPGRVFAKVGAEGVYCMAFPELGLGAALKVHDGSLPHAEAMMAALTERILEIDLGTLARPELRNWNGSHVGDIRPVLG